MNHLETALNTALRAASLSVGNRIYNQVVPRQPTYPLVVFQYQGGGDLNDTKHRHQRPLYLIKAITDTTLKKAGVIDAAIDAYLHQNEGNLTVSGYSSYWLAREEEIRFTETTPEGKRYYHAGGIYRIAIMK